VHALTTRLLVTVWLMGTLLACEGFIEVPRPTARQARPWPAQLMTADEYNATMQDLLGTTSRPADFFPSVSATVFDANVGVLGQLSAVQVEALLDAARELTDEVFASATLRARIVTCTPAPGDVGCVRDSVGRFAQRAFRRSVDADELDGLVAVYDDARARLGLDHLAAMALVTRVVLSHPAVVLRVERPQADGTPEPAALASRLSYLAWGTAPDAALVEAAESGALATAEGRHAALTRLLESPRRSRFVQRFFGQWLGFQRLASHAVDPRLFPRWTPAVALATRQNADDFFTQFLDGSSAWRDVFRAPHQPQAALAPILRDDPPSVRGGMLTLPGYLALSSHGAQTSPTGRARGVITGLFCTDLTPPPGVSTEFEVVPGAAPTTTREKLAEHRKNPACAGCHAILDPVGLSLEHFDAIGAWRTTEGGQPVDASGEYDGLPFSDHRGLAPQLERDARLGPCATQNLLSFALRRSLGAADASLVEAVSSQWQAGSMGELLQLVVDTPDFHGTQEAAR
jgi:hypothetical protein